MFGHVFVDVFRLDLEEETVGVGVEELAPVPVLPQELVIIEVVHQVFREIQNTHPYIHWAIEHQTALVDLDSRQVVIEDIGLSKSRAGDEAPEFVLLVSSHQLHVNPLPQVLHGLPQDQVVHQLVKVLLEVAGCLLPELSIFSAPFKGFDRTGGRDGPQSGAGPETCTAADSDSGARSGSCCGGWGPASQPLLAPPQRRGGCADTPSSTPLPPPCARAPADMHCARCVGQVCCPQAPQPDALRWFLRVVGSRPPTESRWWGVIDIAQPS